MEEGDRHLKVLRFWPMSIPCSQYPPDHKHTVGCRLGFYDCRRCTLNLELLSGK
jgi:hypothetical protein